MAGSAFDSSRPAAPARDALSRACVVAQVSSSGKVLQGTYDGYGRVDGEEVYDDIEYGRLKLVIADFHDKKTDTFASLPSNAFDPGQGYFHDTRFVERVFAALEFKELPNAFGFDARSRQLAMTNEQGIRAVYLALGTPIPEDGEVFHDNHVSEWVLDHAMSALRFAEDERDRQAFTERYSRDVLGKLPDPLKPLSPLLAMGALDAAYDAVGRAARRAVMRAWIAGLSAEKVLEVDWSTALSASPAPSPTTEPAMALNVGSARRPRP
jgi:hypothetical protein